MRYYKLESNLYLVEQSVKLPAAPPPQNYNHVWLIDRSGSMHYLLPQLGKDLIERAKTLKDGDTLSFGWFSGEGQCRFVLKGFSINGNHATLEKVINQNLSSMGTTCFSEILAETDVVISDLAVINPNFAFMMFTDGVPVVYNYGKEIESIQVAIKKIGGKIASSLLVGYGDYYNKELLASMAQGLGGSVVHSQNLPQFSTRMDGFLEEARCINPKTTVILEEKPALGIVFSVQGKSLNVYQEEKGTIQYAASSGDEYVYMFTDKQPLTGTAVADLQKLSPGDSFLQGAYGAAFALSQRSKTDLAMLTLAHLGDRDLVDSLNHAFTNAEYGIAEGKIQEAWLDDSKRYLGGKVKKDYLPAEDAFCLLDVLGVLVKDAEAAFYPYDDRFEYQRIGVPSVTKSGFPKFTPFHDNARCTLQGLTWHESRLNLSIRAKIVGTVPLDDGRKALGLSDNYPTYIYRNYSIVRDGFLNVQKLPVSLSQDAFNQLQAQKVVDVRSRWEDGKICVLHLDRVPVINRAIAKGRTSAKVLCQKALQERQLEGKIKALKYFLSNLDAKPDREDLGRVADYLKTQGVTANGFNPPVEKLESTDVYNAKEFEIKIKGLSSLPKVEAVVAKVTARKTLTPSDDLVQAGIELFEKSGVGKNSAEVKSAWLKTAIETAQSDLWQVRRYIQETKFAITLAKSSFEEFTSREENTLVVDNHQFTITVKDVQVPI